MMAAKPFVFENVVPELEDKEEFLKDYFESVLSKDVQKLELLSAVPDRALVTFDDDCLDIDETNETLDETPLLDTCLKVAIAVQQNAVLLDRRQYSHFESYLDSEVEGGKKIIRHTFRMPGSELVAVCISSTDALDRIFQLKEIEVKPFFQNFHGFIPLDGNLLSEAIQEVQKKPEEKQSKTTAQPAPAPKMFSKRSKKTRRKRPWKPKIHNEVQPEVKKNENITSEKCSSVSGGKDSMPNIAQNSTEKCVGNAPVKVFSSRLHEESKRNDDKDGQITSECVPSSPSENEDVKSDQLISSQSLDEISREKQVGGGEEEEVGSEESYKEPLEREEGENDVEEDEASEGREGLRTMEVTNQTLESEKTQQPEMKAFTAMKSTELSHNRSCETKPKEERKTEVQALKSDSLDLEEHIWKLIKGKLDPSEFCTLKYDERRQILKFRSYNLEACREIIDDLKVDIIESTPLKIPDNLKAMFVELQKKDFFHSCVSDYFERFEVQFVIQRNSILFYGWDEEFIDKTKMEVLQRFMHADEVHNKNGMDISHLRQEKKDLENEFMVTISWTDSQASKVLIHGVYDDVSLAKQRLEEVMDKYVNRTDCFGFSQEHALYIKKHCQYKLDFILQNVKVLFRGDRDGKYIIEYLGKMDDLSTVAKALDKLAGDIKVEDIDIDENFDSEMGGLLTKAIIQNRTNSSFCTLRKMFEIESKCCVLTDTVKQETCSAQELERKQHIKETSQRKDKQPISVQISSNLRVNIKAFGNIVKEKADVLVCPLHESGLLRKLRISKAFLTLFPTLQEQVDALDFSSSQVKLCKITDHDSDAVKAIAFVVLSPWSEDTPQNYLKQLFIETLVESSKLGAKTLVFPPIGLGMVLKYPADVIAKEYFSAIKDYQETTQSTLDKVEVLACDTELYKKLQAESFKFQTLPNSKEREEEENEEELYRDCSLPQVTLKIIHGQGNKNFASLWKEKFKSCMVEDEYSMNSPCMPRHLDNKLKNKMKGMVIIMEKTDTERGELVFKFRGLVEDIQTIKAFITEEVHRDVSRLPHVISDHSPSRGTLEFIEYAASIEESAPPYWTHQTMKSLGDNIFQEVEVDKETAEVIKQLFLSTFDSSLTGHGNDARSIPRQSTIEFVNVKRIENINKFKSYAHGRKQVFKKKSLENELCKSLSQVSKRGQGCLLEPYLSDHMKNNLLYEINECYLLHGTKPNIIETIKRNGCDPAVSNAGAMFGKGVYAAECATKCDQYSDDPQNRLPSGSLHYAFLLRMLLGDIFLCDDSHATVQNMASPKLNRPPCKQCLQDKCYCANTFFYDSVVGEGKWLFREFIVYRDYLCYPEYIICYKRI